MIKKQDTFTPLNKQQEYYSDFTDSFAITPFGNELARVVNERSVSQAIKNLIKTTKGSRLFQPDVGSNVFNLNFEIDDNVTDLALSQSIIDTITNFEPRANLISVTVESNPDNHEIDISITYSLINNPDPISINLTLRKVR